MNNFVITILYRMTEEMMVLIFLRDHLFKTVCLSLNLYEIASLAVGSPKILNSNISMKYNDVFSA